jgi:hypothetical protein
MRGSPTRSLVKVRRSRTRMMMPPDPGVVEDLLAKAGFSDVRITREVRQARFVSVDDFWEALEAGGGTPRASVLRPTA